MAIGGINIQPNLSPEILELLRRKSLGKQQQPIPMRAGGLPGENFFTGQPTIPANQPVTINQVSPSLAPGMRPGGPVQPGLPPNLTINPRTGEIIPASPTTQRLPTLQQQSPITAQTPSFAPANLPRPSPGPQQPVSQEVLDARQQPGQNQTTLERLSQIPSPAQQAQLPQGPSGSLPDISRLAKGTLDSPIFNFAGQGAKKETPSSFPSGIGAAPGIGGVFGGGQPQGPSPVVTPGPGLPLPLSPSQQTRLEGGNQFPPQARGQQLIPQGPGVPSLAGVPGSGIQGPLAAPGGPAVPGTPAAGTAFPINPETGGDFDVGQPNVVQPSPVTIDETTGQPVPGLPTGAPPTGLIGAELALQEGATGSREALLASLGVSRADIEAGGAGALQRLEDARGGITTGTEQSIEAITAGATTGRDIVSRGTTTGVETIGRAGTSGVATLEQGKTEGLEVLNQAFDAAVDPLTGFIDPGKQAQVLQAALTGALGPEAQRAAIADFQNDPSIKFATEEAERALLRNTAAIGGLGGGNVRKELQRQAIGQAQKAFNDRIAQLGKVAATGLTAATAAGGFESQRGLAGTELIGRTAGAVAELGQLSAQEQARLIESGAATEADIEQSASDTISRLTQEGAFAGADISGAQALIERAVGQDLSLLEQSTGLNVAQTIENLGSASAELRSQAGRDIATAIASTVASLAAQQAAEGAGISDIVGTNIANIANLLVSEGLVDAASQEQLAILLGNIAVGQGTTAGNIAANIGQIEAAGILGTSRVVTDGIAGLIGLL